jgi:hypothetical protein
MLAARDAHIFRIPKLSSSSVRSAFRDQALSILCSFTKVTRLLEIRKTDDRGVNVLHGVEDSIPNQIGQQNRCQRSQHIQRSEQPNCPDIHIQRLHHTVSWTKSFGGEHQCADHQFVTTTQRNSGRIFVPPLPVARLW